MSEAIERLWNADDLGKFLGLSPQTITANASRSPGSLPARVSSIRALRWVPSVCHEWALKHSAPPVRKKVGRPRLAA